MSKKNNVIRLLYNVYLLRVIIAFLFIKYLPVYYQLYFILSYCFDTL